MGIKEKAGVTGMVTIDVIRDGKVVKTQKHHNIITAEGDKLIADWMQASPQYTKVDNANGYIQVGTGWASSGKKTATSCNVPTGNPVKMSVGFPQTADSVTTYSVEFPAGALQANGINEACLLNGINPDASGVLSLAYAEITPAVNITQFDSLRITWDITILGA